MQLIHYSVAGLRLPIESREQDPAVISVYDKPHGLWLSVGKDWRRWCEEEGFNLGRLAVAQEVELDPAARILRLSTKDDLLCFTERYGALIDGFFSVAIRWSAVARDYQGIAIAPYVWVCRLLDRTKWYYTWDCASACVWDAAAIAKVARIAQEQGMKRTRKKHNAAFKAKVALAAVREDQVEDDH